MKFRFKQDNISLLTTFILLTNFISSELFANTVTDQWAKLPPKTLSCMREMAKPQNGSLENIIANGISPTDPRIAPVIENCKKVTSERKKNYSCQLQDQSGNFIDTMCNEFLVIQQNGQTDKINEEQAIQVMARGGTVNFFNEETPDALQARLNKISNALSNQSNINNSNIGQQESSQISNNEMQPQQDSSQSSPAVSSTQGSVSKNSNVSQNENYWLYRKWCLKELEDAKKTNPNIKPLVLICSEEFGCTFETNIKNNTHRNINIKWTSKGNDRASTFSWNYGDRNARALFGNPPADVNLGEFDCSYKKLGENLQKDCKFAIYKEPIKTETSLYIPCD